MDLKKTEGHGGKDRELVDMYIKTSQECFGACSSCLAWGITLVERNDIGRVQKSALYAILGYKLMNYGNALKLTNLDSLQSRRDKLCLKFVKKAEKHPKHRKWFNQKPKFNTRQKQNKYCNVVARTERLKSAF